MATTKKRVSAGKRIESPSMAELRHNWGWVLTLGIIFLILGCIGLGMSVGLTLVSMIFFSALLLISGFWHAIDVFKYRDWKGIVGQALIALLYLAAGIAVLYDPFLASALITAFLAGALIVIGTTRLVMASTVRQDWGWLVFAGLAAIVLGILILLQWPVSGLWVIGLFIAIEMIVNGWSYIFIALSLRSKGF